jgi:hypothetical protein
MNEWLKYGLLAAGGYFVWSYFFSEEGNGEVFDLPADPAATRPPPSNTQNPGALPGSVPPDAPPAPLPPAPLDAFDGVEGSPPRPPATDQRSPGRGRVGSASPQQVLKAAMLESAAGDPNVKNVWVWNWHFSSATNSGELPVDQAALFPGQTFDQIAGNDLSWEQWYSLMAPVLPSQVSIG